MEEDLRVNDLDTSNFGFVDWTPKHDDDLAGKRVMDYPSIVIRTKRNRLVGLKKVLKGIPIIHIFDTFIEIVAPKPIYIMWKWIKDRIKEPSTYQGLSVLLGAVGVTLSPELWQEISTVIASVIGLIQVVKKEAKESVDADK